MTFPSWLRTTCAVGNTVGLALGFATSQWGLTIINAVGLLFFVMTERAEDNGR